jgi:predicted Mrr-cat superfamily restriction endonuclease
VEHGVPVAFAVLVFNCLCRTGQCSVALVKAVFEIIYSPHNFQLMDKDQNSSYGNMFSTLISKLEEKFGEPQWEYDEANQKMGEIAEHIKTRLNQAYLQYLVHNFENLTSYFSSPDCGEFVRVARKLLGLP